MKLSTLKRNLKNKFASEILGAGSRETQLVFSFEFAPKPANKFNLKAIIKKMLVAGIVGLGFTVCSTTASASSMIIDAPNVFSNMVSSMQQLSELQSEANTISLTYLSIQQQAQQQAMITNEILGMPNVDEVTVTTIHAFKKA